MSSKIYTYNEIDRLVQTQKKVLIFINTVSNNSLVLLYYLSLETPNIYCAYNYYVNTAENTSK